MKARSPFILAFAGRIAYFTLNLSLEQVKSTTIDPSSGPLSEPERSLSLDDFCRCIHTLTDYYGTSPLSVLLVHR